QRNWMRGRTGALNHNWAGGKIWWRGKNWTTIKLEIKKRDAFRCLDCGMTEEEHVALTGQPLSVDHVIPYRISHDNSPHNLRTLCGFCHGKKTPLDVILMQQVAPLLV